MLRDDGAGPANASNPSADIREERLGWDCGMDKYRCCNLLETAAIAPNLAVIMAERHQSRYDIRMARRTGKGKFGAQKAYRFCWRRKLTYRLVIVVLG